jgi:hypothetical protein
LLLAVIVLGVSGLATLVTDKTDRLVASATNHQEISTGELGTQSEAFTGTPAKPLDTLYDPTAKPQPTTAHNTSKRTSTCNLTTQKRASLRRAQQLRAEADRHRQVLWSLQTTGLVTKFFNPSMYSSRISQENAKHRDIVQQIARSYSAAFAQAHCKN